MFALSCLGLWIGWMGTEQGKTLPSSKHKKSLKRDKHKEERSRFKQQMERGEEPQDGYGKFKGWAD